MLGKETYQDLLYGYIHGYIRGVALACLVLTEEERETFFSMLIDEGGDPGKVKEEMGDIRAARRRRAVDRVPLASQA